MPLRKLAYDFAPIHNVVDYSNMNADLNHTYITGINPPWSWCFIYLCTDKFDLFIVF